MYVVVGISIPLYSMQSADEDGDASYSRTVSSYSGPKCEKFDRNRHCRKLYSCVPGCYLLTVFNFDTRTQISNFSFCNKVRTSSVRHFEKTGLISDNRQWKFQLSISFQSLYTIDHKYIDLSRKVTNLCAKKHTLYLHHYHYLNAVKHYKWNVPNRPFFFFWKKIERVNTSSLYFSQPGFRQLSLNLNGKNENQ